MIDQGVIMGRIAKSVADDMVKFREKSCLEIVKENPDYQPVSDTKEIEPLVDQVIEKNPESVRDFKEGREKALSFLVGQVMKLTRGKATPQLVNDLLKKKLIDKTTFTLYVLINGSSHIIEPLKPLRTRKLLVFLF